MRNITIGLGSAGVLMVVAATIRWAFVYYDLSQLIQAVLIGVIFIGAAFVYEKIQNIQDDLRDLMKMRKQIKQEIIDYISS